MTVQEIRTRLRKLGNKQRATDSQRYFKTRAGEYGEGDMFLGIRVPELRKLAKEYQGITLTEATQLLRSAIHEERLLALLILVCAISREKFEAYRAISRKQFLPPRKNTQAKTVSQCSAMGTHREPVLR